MPYTSGPYTPLRDVPFTAQNPLLGSGNVVSVAAVVKNASSFLLKVSSESGAIVAQVDPFTTDQVKLDPGGGQQLTLLPTSLGFINLQTVVPTVYIDWYQAGEKIEATYPYGIAGATQLQIQGLASVGVNLAGNASAQLLPAPPANNYYRLVEMSAVTSGSVAGVALNVVLDYQKTAASGTFVVTAYNTSIALTSPDGVTWTQRALPLSSSWLPVCFGAGVFVILDQTSIALTSPDGVTWTQRALPSVQQWQSVIFANGQFVAVAYASAVAATSPDGVTWTQRALPSSSTWQGLAFGAGVYVAVSASAGAGNAATSPDGITWTAQSMPAVPGFNGVAFGAGVFTAVAGGSAVAATSPDGVTWTQRVLPSSLSWNPVAFGAGLFATVAFNTSIVATSPDGVTWTQRALPVSSTWEAMTFGNGLFVAVAYNHAIAVTSPDGVTWTQRALPLASYFEGVAGAVSSPAQLPNVVAFSGLPGDALVDARALHGIPVGGEVTVTAGPAANNVDTQVWLFYDLVEF